MISLETRHFNVNRILLLLVGLWPYRRSLLIRFQLIIHFGILITYIIVQFAVLMTPCTLDVVLKVFSTTFFFMCIAVKYNAFLLNSDVLKILLERLQDVCDELKDENEIAIIQKYGYKAKRYTYAIILLGLFGEFIIMFLQIWPYLYQTFIQSVNKSLHFPDFIATEYFIDREKYSYLITLHQYTAWCVGGISLVATGSYLITYLQHTCGLFSIASYRLEQALMADISQQNILKNEKQICTEIIHAIDIHRKALEFNEFFISSFEKSFFFLILTGIVSLVFNLLMVTTNTEIQQLLLPLTMILILYVYLFLSNYIAQEVTNHNEYVFLTVYNVKWYVAPVQIQKMMLFLLQKGTKSFHLILGGIFVACMESAASVLSTTISFCTVIYSTLQNE